MRQNRVTEAFHRFRHSHHAKIKKAHDWADLGYLFATLAEFHTAHIIAVAVLFGIGCVHVLLIEEV